jgi:hypothetical protein
LDDLFEESVPLIQDSIKSSEKFIRLEGYSKHIRGIRQSWEEYEMVDSTIQASMRQVMILKNTNSVRDVFSQTMSFLDSQIDLNTHYPIQKEKHLSWISMSNELVSPRQLEFQIKMLELDYLSEIMRSISHPHTGMWLFPYRECTDVLNPRINQKIKLRRLFTAYPRVTATTWINGDSITSPYSDFTYPIRCTQSPLQPIYIRMEYEDPVTEAMISQVDTFYLNVAE